MSESQAYAITWHEQSIQNLPFSTNDNATLRSLEIWDEDAAKWKRMSCSDVSQTRSVSSLLQTQKRFQPWFPMLTSHWLSAVRCHCSDNISWHYGPRRGKAEKDWRQGMWSWSRLPKIPPPPSFGWQSCFISMQQKSLTVENILFSTSNVCPKYSGSTCDYYDRFKKARTSLDNHRKAAMPVSPKRDVEDLVSAQIFGLTIKSQQLEICKFSLHGHDMKKRLSQFCCRFLVSSTRQAGL